MNRWYDGKLTDYGNVCPISMRADEEHHYYSKCTPKCACLVINGKERYFDGATHITYTAHCGLAKSNKTQACFKSKITEMEERDES